MCFICCVGFRIGILTKLKDLKVTSRAKSANDKEDILSDCTDLKGVKTLLDFLALLYIKRFLNEPESHAIADKVSIQPCLCEDLPTLRFARGRSLNEIHDAVETIKAGISAASKELNSLHVEDKIDDSETYLEEFKNRLDDFVSNSISYMTKLEGKKMGVTNLVSNVLQYMAEEGDATKKTDAMPFEDILNLLWEFSCQFDGSISKQLAAAV